tara:strand:- start:134 stop:1123 length:990 start_codon:yes stop_codon:yes gene_type:complete
MSVLLSLIPSVIGTGVGLAQQGKLRRDLAERQQAAEGQFDRSLQAIRDISFEPSQQLRDARMSQLEAGRAIGDMAAQRTDEAQARAIAALRDSPRALQSAGTRVIDSALAAQQQADVAGTQQTLAGEMGMAQDAERARMQALQRDLSLEQMLMNRAAQAGDVAQSGIFASQAATTEGVMAMGNALTQGLLQQGDFLNRNATAPNYNPADFAQFGTESSTPSNPIFDRGATIGDILSPEQQAMISAAGFEEGGYIGEEGGVTEGEFDHDTNKKAIIDEENGQKEGELTGGEMVLNPEQTDGITTLVEKGDAEGLLMFLRDLLSQPQFQEA